MKGCQFVATLDLLLHEETLKGWSFSNWRETDKRSLQKSRWCVRRVQNFNPTLPALEHTQ